MKIAIITPIPHVFENNQYYSYAPYVREMNIWVKFADAVILVATKQQSPKTAIDIAYEHKNITFIKVPAINILGFSNILQTALKAPGICYQIYKAMKAADHIHLRCPGNVGLLGCMVQILFPRKPKTAKYAGNWDPNSRQPWSYKLQQWILSNTFLTKNIQVLVYGRWENSTKNIRPFFTATYLESDKTPIVKRRFDSTIKFLFVGTLSYGKRPLYAIQLVESLNAAGHNVILELYGEGKERKSLEQYIKSKNLGRFVMLLGNQPEAAVRKAYKESHFLLLPSQSEGWPKVVAEAMFWGCLPVATKVSCVPFMLDYGNRGMIAGMDLNHDAQQIAALIENPQQYSNKITESVEWSRKYTLDLFEDEVEKLLMP